MRKVLLASPRGYCAGVERAVETVDRALELYGPPVYMRKQIVHNLHVVRELEARGVIFVEDEAEVPVGETVVFSAHGVAPSVHENSAARELRTIDATCPLVTKVHVQAQSYSARGREIILIGHPGHPEVEGTRGRIEGPVTVLSTVEEVEALRVRDPDHIAYVTQTTLSVDDTRATIEAIKSRFSDVIGPETRDICYATQNRQTAVRQLCEHVELLLVVGAANSSNSNRLREIGAECGIEVDEARQPRLDAVGVGSALLRRVLG